MTGTRANVSPLIAIAILLGLCLGFAALHWLRLGTLWGAGPLWLSQAALALHGMPYRDFLFSYPPLSIWLFQIAFLLLGQSFWVAQLVIDLLSIIIVLLTYVIAARILPRSLALLAGVLLIGVSDSGFMLFSLQIYTPALLTGTVGIQLMTLGVLDRHQRGYQTPRTMLLTIMGCCIAVLSKPEFMGAAASCLFASCFLALYDQRRSSGTAFKKFLSSAVPPLLGFALAFEVFFILAQMIGFEKLKTALSGYGMGSVACPWWPTGLGLFGAVASLGEAVAIVALLTLFRFRSLAASYGWRYYLALAVAFGGAVIYTHDALSFMSGAQAAQNYAATAGEISDRFGVISGKAIAFAGYLFTKRNVFLPVMWANIAISSVFFIVKITSRNVSAKINDGLFLVMLVTCGLSVRQLFGDYAEAYTNVAVPAYPFLYILLVAFLYYATKWICSTGREMRNPAGAAVLTTVLIVGVYAGSRAVLSIFKELRAGYSVLQTQAGRAYLNDPQAIAIYQFIAAHSGPKDRIADIGGTSRYPGGLNFALRRPSPMFSNLFTDIEPTDWIMTEDAKRFERASPKFVIGTDPFQVQYGLLNAWNRCQFPAIVWAPHTANFVNSKRYPIIDAIRSSYTKTFQSGQWVVFSR